MTAFASKLFYQIIIKFRCTTYSAHIYFNIHPRLHGFKRQAKTPKTTRLLAIFNAIMGYVSLYLYRNGVN